MITAADFLRKLLRRGATRRDGRLRLAIIGSCHIAALRLAEHENRVDLSGFDTCYYGGAGVLFQNMTLDKGQISIHRDGLALELTNGRYKTLPIDEFDAFLFHGGWVSVLPYLRRAARAKMVLDQVSNGFTQALTREVLQLESAKMQMPITVARQTGRPVILSASPLKAAHSQLFSKSIAKDTNTDRFTQACIEILREYDLHFLPQSPETVVDNVYTADEYSTGSVRLQAVLDKAHPEDDYGHMNAQYGAIVLENLTAMLRAILSPQTKNSDGPKPLEAQAEV